jgi:hypothetical protein
VARRFSVSDAMLLIASAGLVLWGGVKPFDNMVEQFIGMCQAIMDPNNFRYRVGPTTWRQDVWMRWSTVLWYFFQVIDVLVFSLTPALLLIRTRPPRPSIRAILRQPGTIACLAIAFGYLWVFGWLDRLLVGQMHYQPGIAVAVGGTVAFAWSVLALSKQWQSEPGWIDGTGRVLGTAAIAAALIVITHFGI